MFRACVDVHRLILHACSPEVPSDRYLLVSDGITMTPVFTIEMALGGSSGNYPGMAGLRQGTPATGWSKDRRLPMYTKRGVINPVRSGFRTAGNVRYDPIVLLKCRDHDHARSCSYQHELSDQEPGELFRTLRRLPESPDLRREESAEL